MKIKMIFLFYFRTKSKFDVVKVGKYFANHQMKFVFLLTYSYFDFIEDTIVRKKSNEICFFAHLFVSLPLWSNCCIIVGNTSCGLL